MERYCKSYIPYFFIIPAGIVLLLFFFIPFLETFWLSFKSYRGDIYAPEWVGLSNYTELINSSLFWKTLLNTFIYLIGVVPALVIIPLIIAIIVNRKLAGINIFRTIIYIPVVISIVVAGIAWKWIYAEKGILNYIVSFIGMDKTGWLTNPDYALYSVMFVTIWKGLGYYMVIYLAYLTAVPKEQLEAAEIDGASIVQKHIAVTIPYLMPAITFVTIMSSIAAMKVFVEIYVMTQGGPMNSSKTIVYYIYQRAFENLDLGYASAVGVILFITTMFLSVLNIKFFERSKYPGM